MLHTLAIFLDWFEILFVCGADSRLSFPRASIKAPTAGGEEYTPAAVSQGNLLNFPGIIVSHDDLHPP